MKITTDHLEKVRTLLSEASEHLASQSKVAREAEESRLQFYSQVRGLQGAFDILAAAYAGDVEPSASQLDSLPAAAQNALGYAPVLETAPAT